jgi:serine protease Do
MKRQTFLLLGFASSVAFLVGLVVAGSRPVGEIRSGLARPTAQSRPLNVAVAAPVVEQTAGVGVDFSIVAARLNSAVVNIDAASRGPQRRSETPRFGRQPRGDSGPREGAGSGFVIDPAGYILTNYHVVEEADRVAVTLADGRVLRASVVGIDPAIDVALLHIPASNLPVAPLGDSDGLRVGEWVCAIGNPLGYVHSVTVGVISFLGRKVWDPSLDAFIQTDAGISYGNSGGPLINARGEVVGITTAMSSQASSIGFAIPINQVMAVLPQLKERGRVTRGYLGVSLTTATPDLRRSLHLSTPHGALVEDVVADTPAERAGLRAYDLIVGADEAPIASDDDLIRYVAGRAPGSVTQLAVWRDGSQQTVRVRLSERPVPRSARPLPGGTGVEPVRGRPPLGLVVQGIDVETTRRLRLPEGLVGVLVTDVDPAGPARLAGVRPGHVVLEINRRRVTSAGEFRDLVASLPAGASAVLFVYDRLSDQRALYSIGLDPQ